MPNGFNDFLNFGDFIYLKNNDDYLSLDQIPEVEASLDFNKSKNWRS